jgi:pyruvate kinase
MGRTRIVATLGPATSTEERIRALVDAGVDVFRLNFSHGTHDEHGARIAAIRKVVGKGCVAILQDLCGPKFRLDRPVTAKPGDVVEVPIPASVRPGDTVLLADGVMHLEVVGPNRLKAVTGGSVPAGKGINFPASRLDIPSLTKKDRVDLEFGVSQGVDFVALSFVRRASDLDEVKKCGRPVVAKIETAAAVERMDEIVHAADAIMVARGDLGVEIPIERVPAVQKRLIALANRESKPVITATQMLRSMVDNPLPTRAEATDVANAVLDGTDATMLSEETAAGNYPVEAVRMMERIFAETEPLLARRMEDPGHEWADVLAFSACDIAGQVGARAIVVPTHSGFTAKKVARWRPPIPIVVLTPFEEVRRRLALVWGVTPVLTPLYETADLLDLFREPVKATGLVPPGSTVVVTGGWPFGKAGTTNLLHVTKL